MLMASPRWPQPLRSTGPYAAVRSARSTRACTSAALGGWRVCDSSASCHAGGRRAARATRALHIVPRATGGDRLASPAVMLLGDPPSAGRLRPSLGVLAAAGALGALLVALGAWSTGVFPQRSQPGLVDGVDAVRAAARRRLGGLAGRPRPALGGLDRPARPRPGRPAAARCGRGRRRAVGAAAAGRPARRQPRRLQLRRPRRAGDPGRSTPGRRPRGRSATRRPYLQGVDPVWRGVVSAYGPASTVAAEARLSASADHDITRYGPVACGRGWSAASRCWASASSRWPGARARNRVDALVLAVAGPLTLVHLVGGAAQRGAHGRASWSCGLALAAWRPGPRARWAGTALIALGAAVKAPGPAGGRVPRLAVRRPPRRRCWVRVARTAGLLARGRGRDAGSSTCATGLSWGWLGGVTGRLQRHDVPVGVDHPRAARPVAVRAARRRQGHDARRRSRPRSARRPRRRRRADVAHAQARPRRPRRRARSCSAVAGASLHPWYLVWALPVLAVVRGRSPGDRRSWPSPSPSPPAPGRRAAACSATSASTPLVDCCPCSHWPSAGCGGGSAQDQLGVGRQHRRWPGHQHRREAGLLPALQLVADLVDRARRGRRPPPSRSGTEAMASALLPAR